MLNFLNLKIQAYKTDSDKINDFLLDFFNKKNFKEYEIDEDADRNQVKAIKIMFTSSKDLKKRIEDAFDYDMFCREAFLAYYLISEAVFLQLRFNQYYSLLDEYAEFNEYEKKCYIDILNIYGDFYGEIHNYTKCINVSKMVIKLANKASDDIISKLSYMYFLIEDEKEYYRLYTNYELDTIQYLLLIVTLLKYDEDLKAQEVLLDMFEKNEYALYLDHIWDLDDKDEEQRKFYAEVDSCFEDLMSVPNLFSWINKVKTKYGK